MYQEIRTLKLFHTDETGVLFYARLFEIAQETLENLLNKEEIGLGTMIREKNFITPVVHAEADYYRPLRTGYEIRVIVKSVQIGQTSFTTITEFEEKKKELVARTKVVNVCVEKKTGKKIAVPQAFKEKIQKHFP